MSVAESETPDSLVAAEVRAWMGRRGMRQVQLAAAMEVDEIWVSRKLRGKTRITVEDVYAFADALDCEVAALLPRLDSNQQPFDYLPMAA